MNNFSLNLPPSDTLWYTPMDHHNHHHHHHHQLHQQNKSLPLFYSLNNFSQNDDDSDNSTSNNHNYATSSNDNRSQTTSSQSQHERMFEKPLTPSDVGKLNRLVIPKQHAEKYFPLAGVSAAEDGGGSGGGGVLLGFEDETGKCWRFRYSYWNSSQSYVLTKGWSRYVKEKKLDAGDVVLFERHRFESDRCFIGWRRRGSTAPVHLPVRQLYNAVQVRQVYPVPPPQRIATASFRYQSVGCFHAGAEVRPPTQKAARSGSGGGNSKKLRLFGVNLECQLEDEDEDEEPQTSDGSSLSSQDPNHGLGSGSGAAPTTYNYFNYAGYTSNHHHNHMDVNFPEDVNQMG